MGGDTDYYQFIQSSSMQDYTRRLKTPREHSDNKDQPLNFEKYGEHLRNELEEISRMIARKHRPKKEEEAPSTPSLNLSKRQPSENEKSPPMTAHSSVKSSDSGHGEVRQAERENKRNLIYDTESFKDQVEETQAANTVNNSPSNNEIFTKLFLSKSPYSETMSTASSRCEQEGGLRVADFAIGKKLGSGKFGDVFVARHKRSGFVCALKRIGKGNMDPKLLVQLVREIKIQSFLSHPNIVKLYTFFADKTHIYLVQELCASGQLYSLLKKRRKLPEELTRVIVGQICRALDYMHQCEIIHRDLKPENIIFHNGLVKICDFGWSISSKTMRETFCGTPLYVSPELLKRKNYNNKIDVWSVGILTYELLFGRVPFEIITEKDFVKIIQDEIKFTKAMPVSEEAKDFILVCLKKDPRDRYTVPELLEHPFLALKDSPALADLS